MTRSRTRSRRSNDNLTREESAIKRRIAAYHGYTQSRGRQAGEGSAFALDLAIINGDVQTASLEPEELALVVPWLAAQAADLAATNPALAEALEGLANQLGQALASPVELPPHS